MEGAEQTITDNTRPFENRIDLSGVQQAATRIRREIRKLIVGQQDMVDLLLAALLADGHVLIEGVPGVAKTLTAKLLARTVSAGFSRIQFTPDLMPSDITGTSVFDPQAAAFEFRPGPIFSNLVLIDEVNRAPAKTQAALFEVMEERQVTVDGVTYPMKPPFLVLATQNPLEHEGTYRLPEAQLDRFLFKVEVGYPSLDEETQILSEFHARHDRNDLSVIEPVLTGEDVLAHRETVRRLHVDAHLVAYIAQIVHQTRGHKALYVGASPRASLAILTGAKAVAALSGRDFVTPEDIRRVTTPVLRHRILLTPDREMEGVRPADVIRQIVEQIDVPR